MGRLVALAVVLVLVAGSASAAAPQRKVTIQFRLRFTVQDTSSGSLAGTFRATGAIFPSPRTTSSRFPACAISNRSRRLTGFRPSTRPQGVLTIVYTGIVSSAAPDMTVTEGRWAISNASGRFRGMHGRGRFSAIVNLTTRTMVKRYDGVAT